MIISIRKMESVLQWFLLSVLFLGFTNIFSTVAADSITVNYDANSTRYKTIEDFDTPLEVQCNTTESGVRIEWYKDNKNITNLDGRIKAEGNRLVIKEPTIEDTGNYTCKAVYTKVNGTIAGEKQIEVVVKPQVGIHKDVTVVEGEKLKLECIVKSSAPTTVSWRFGNNETYEESRDRVILESYEGVPNAAFIIKEAQMSDRGEYTCIAESANSTSEAKVYVRVKDKLAALWPFLGICAEVLVLCAIILIYEKKRNKTELEESDTDNSPETKNTPDHGKDAVRQRK